MNLLMIESVFGTVKAGGCPACFLNVQSFWCEYTCSPRQAEFARVVGETNMTDPETGRTFEVLETLVKIDRDFACALYDSCSSVTKVTQVSAMSNVEGFFAYQGQVEAIQHGAFINFDLNPPPNASAPALQASPYSCCNFPSNPLVNTSANTSCPCSFCKGMCPGKTCGAGSGGGAGDGSDIPGQAETPVLNGFNPALVGGVWAGVVALAVAHLIAQRWFPAAAATAEGGIGGGGGDKADGDADSDSADEALARVGDESEEEQLRFASGATLTSPGRGRQGRI